MSKKKNNLFPLVTGAVLGAVAVIFSKKENREKAKEVGKKAEKKVKKFKEEYDKDKKVALNKAKSNFSSIFKSFMNDIGCCQKKIKKEQKKK